MIDYPIERQLAFACLERDEAQARVTALTTLAEAVLMAAAMQVGVAGDPVSAGLTTALTKLATALDAAGGTP